ncbi:MAG: hypothetical protein U0361_02100 [Nitrospiraceae bacterium]
MTPHTTSACAWLTATSPRRPKPGAILFEWINLSDSTGKTYTFEKDAQIKQGADGRFYFDYGPFVDYRLFAVVAFVAAIILSGMRVQRHVVNRYRMRLKPPPTTRSRFIDLKAEGERRVAKKYVYYFEMARPKAPAT